MAINFRGAEFVGTFSEITGYKSGLALTGERFREIFATGGYDDIWPTDPDSWLRIRSEKVEEIFAFTLAQLGVGPPVHVIHPHIFVYHRVKHDHTKLSIFEKVGAAFNEFLQNAVKQTETAELDRVPFIEAAYEEHGEAGFEIAVMLTDALIAHQLQSPWSVMRRVEWRDVRQLSELFESERLEGPHGDYFDERFATFLSANFDEIGSINWRQFEGLSAEYFAREGYAVELGPGRNDDGVDIRLRPADAPDGSPAVILVQCKREARRIGKTVVKALWADVVAEGAESGLIVTTSGFSPGAEAMRSARGYPIVEADRMRVREFVEALRTPGSGVYLAE